MAVPEVLTDDVPTQPAKRQRCDATAPKPDAPPASAGSPTPAESAAPRTANGTAPAEASDASPTGRGEIVPPVVATETSQSRAEPPPYAAGGYVAAGDGWWAHGKGEWLYNVAEKTYFHLPSGELRLALDEGTVPLSLATTAETQNPDGGTGTSAVGSGESSPAVLSGQVKWFNRVKGFGFLEPLQNGSDSAEVFFHKNQLVGEDIDLRCIRPGVQLSYSLGETDDGRTCAVQVKVAGSHGSAGGTNGKHVEAADEDAKDDAEEEAEGEDPEEGEASSSESSVDIDLFEELHSGMYQVKGETKDECEDFAVDKVKLPISVLGETATCVFFGVFDGHGGGYCAEYAAAHLAKNVLARLRDRTKTASDEMALRTALLGGFRQTEHNFLQHARRVGDCSGTTACTMTVFGPDEEMRLRLFLANAGDSRALLVKASGGFLRLTEDHKPNLPAEKKRIEAEGGSVVEVAGVWRAILPPQKRRTSGIVGLAVSRSLGDKDFKAPNIVNPDPDITIHEVDWDDDEFVIIASDGIWDVVSDKDAARLVQRSLRQFGNEEKAAEELVCKARDRGTKDDCTALIVRFGWLKAKLGEGADAEHASEPEEEDDDLEAKAPEERAAEAPRKPIDEEDGDDAEEDAEEEEEEEAEESEEEVEEARGRPAGALPRVTGADDSDDDIFASVPEEKEDGGAQAKDPAERAPQIATPAADASELFAGLGPTREELLVVEGPALPAPRPAAAGEGAGEAAPGGAPAVDEALDMFGE